MLIAVLVTTSVAQFRANRAAPTGKNIAFEHDGRERDYRLHVPSSYQPGKPTPLVVCLHGGGGNSGQISAMGMTPVADEHGFIVAYPNAINKHWNDGRESEMFLEHDRTIDDVAFIMSIVQRIQSEFNIDTNRVFATGVSNGGFMSQRLAMEHSDVFSAIGIVVASMGRPLKDKFAPKHPVSVLYMNGTADPLVPYEGGELTVNLFPALNRLRGQPQKSRGFCIPTSEAVDLWVKRNGIEDPPNIQQLPNKDTSDGCRVELSEWTGGQNGTTVALYKVIDGGHTLPGRNERMPERLVGKTNRDIKGYETIWNFFVQHGRGPIEK